MYQHIARYYDLLHNELVDDIEFLINVAETTGGPLLELGCGTGRILLPLARSGHRVLGVDASPEMLAVARTRLAGERPAVQSRVALRQADFTEIDLDEEFGLAIIAYNTLMHLAPQAVAKSLTTVRRYLRPNGMLFIDVDNPTDVHDPGQDGLLLMDRTASDAERDEIVVLSVSSIGDGERQTRETTWLIDVSPANGGPVKRTVAQSTLHYYFAHQLQQILQTAGFRPVGQFGDYQRHPYDADGSPRLLILASVD
jgi:SAM-dependent methyltransferase